LGILKTYFREATCLRGLQTFNFGLEFLTGEEITDSELDNLVELITTVTTVQRLALKMPMGARWFGGFDKMERLKYISWKVTPWKAGLLLPRDENWESITAFLKN
jgi:hypothetical protein